MGKIIDSHNLEEHNVKKFEFASLEVSEEKKSSFNKALFSEELQEETPLATQEVEEELTPNAHEANDLLEKIETLSDENVSLTMKLETLQKEFDEKIKESSESAYQKGREEGVKDTQETLQEHNDDLNTQLLKSITSLDEQVHQHEQFLKSIEDELVETSIIIAKKIIKKELDEHSSEVANTLAKTFLDDLKEASAITLKVNPKDAHFIKEQYEDKKNITIEADDAINKGGIIILSDIGNIDGNITTRMEKAIALIEREG